VELTIITPERLVLEAADVNHVLLPAANGELGVLPGHVAMVCRLNVGRIRVDSAAESVELATSGGFAEVLEDNITVLVEAAERADEIDVARAQRARDRARIALERREEKVEDATLRGALARALNRIDVASED